MSEEAKPSKRIYVVYVAGPYRHAKEIGVYGHIHEARMYAAHLWGRGFAAVCPHANTAFMGGACPDEHFLAGDIEILRRCDAVLMIPGWQNSEGARGEKAEAERLGIPVFTEIGPLLDWRDDRDAG